MAYSTRPDARAGSGASVASANGLKLAMRKLWSDHVIWTRMYIAATVDGTPDKLTALPSGVRTPAGVHVPAAVFEGVGPLLGDAEAAAGRLLKNQEDIGEAIVPYFGRDAGHQLTTLLKEHIMIAVTLVDSALKNKTQKFAETDTKWYENADEIATFLSRANEHWRFEDLQSLLHLHLQLTKNEAVARVARNYDGDVKVFDEIYAEAMTIADALSDGLVKKFPEKFTATQGA